MSLAAAGWETHSLYIPSSVFVADKDVAGLFAADILLREQKDQPDGVLTPPPGWSSSHVVAVLLDEDDAQWFELYTADPTKRGKPLGGRHAPEAGDLSIPLPCGLDRLRIVAKTTLYAPTLYVLLARKP